MLVILLVVWWYVVFPLLWLLGAYWIFKRAKSRWTKFVVLAGALVMWYPVMFWDDLLGYGKWRHLCNDEGTIRVYRTVTLDAEHYDSRGYPRYAKETLTDGRIRLLVGDRYELKHETFDRYSSWPLAVRKYRVSVIDRSTGDVLGEAVEFGRYRGGPPRPMPDQHGELCPAQTQAGELEVVKRIFKKTT